MPQAKTVCQALSELVLCKIINCCPLKQLKLRVEQLPEHPTFPMRCLWWGVGYEAPLQPCTMTLSWAGFAGQRDTGSHAWSPACCGAAWQWSKGPFKMLLRADEPWWYRAGLCIHPTGHWTMLSAQGRAAHPVCTGQQQNQPSFQLPASSPLEMEWGRKALTCSAMAAGRC